MRCTCGPTDRSTKGEKGRKKKRKTNEGLGLHAHKFVTTYYSVQLTSHNVVVSWWLTGGVFPLSFSFLYVINNASATPVCRLPGSHASMTDFCLLHQRDCRVGVYRHLPWGGMGRHPMNIHTCTAPSVFAFVGLHTYT